MHEQPHVGEASKLLRRDARHVRMSVVD